MDFCYAWLRQLVGKEAEGFDRASTRSPAEPTGARPLDEKCKAGNRTRLLRFKPGAHHIDGIDITTEAVVQTQEAMRAGTEIIVQGALSRGGWGGRADILRRVETPSVLGDWSYEVMDTKLSRETKSGMRPVSGWTAMIDAVNRKSPLERSRIDIVSGHVATDRASIHDDSPLNIPTWPPTKRRPHHRTSDLNGGGDSHELTAIRAGVILTFRLNRRRKKVVWMRWPIVAKGNCPSSCPARR
jgi:hypothetical protein